MAEGSIPVAAYYRMSTLKQEDSIDRQRSQVVPLCERRGFHVVAEYIDEGVAGDEILKRRDFQRMLRDAQAGRLFRGIVCDDKDRFGRFDAIDLGEVVAPLRRKGVWVETVAQGRIDWETFAGRITDAVLQEAKNLESDAISRRVLSNQLLKARDGIFTGGRAPYGYRWEPDPRRGRRLVPDGRPADVVRLVFRMYDQGRSLMAIADELYQRGVASPWGKTCWTRTVIMRLLKNRRYVGDWTWGVHPQGKRHRYTRKEVSPTARRVRAPRCAPVDDWLVLPNAHEPLVDRDQFERVQDRLVKNRGLTTPHVNGGTFVLNRLMVCGGCGSRLCGLATRGRREYVCRAYLAHGRAACYRHAVEEGPMLRFLVGKLKDAHLGGHLEALRRDLATQEARDQSDANRDRLARRVADLEGKLRQGNERLAIVPPDRIPGLTETLRGWERELGEVRRELRRVETESPTERLEQAVAAAERVLWELQEAVQGNDVPVIRNALAEMVDHIELHWEHYQVGRQTRCRLTGGVIWMRTSEGLSEWFPSATRQRWSGSPRPTTAGRPPPGSHTPRSNRPIGGSPGTRQSPRP
jgi:DNA invertase Pin-like site-specific DNA recombinase